MARSEVLELPLEVGQALGEPVALLAQRLGCRLDVGREVPVPVRSLSRPLLHDRLRQQERCRGQPLTGRELPGQIRAG